MTVIIERVKILSVINKAECSVKSLLKAVGIPQQAINKHLDALLSLNMIERKEAENEVKYVIKPESRQRVNILLEQYL